MILVAVVFTPLFYAIALIAMLNAAKALARERPKEKAKPEE